MATAPGPILEVGCGQGFFLKDAAKRGCRVVGIEVNRDLVTELTEAGIEAQLGRAEKLPFGPLASMLQVDGWPLAVRDPPAQPSRFQILPSSFCSAARLPDRSLPTRVKLLSSLRVHLRFESIKLARQAC